MLLYLPTCAADSGGVTLSLYPSSFEFCNKPRLSYICAEVMLYYTEVPCITDLGNYTCRIIEYSFISNLVIARIFVQENSIHCIPGFSTPHRVWKVARLIQKEPCNKPKFLPKSPKGQWTSIFLVSAKTVLADNRFGLALRLSLLPWSKVL